MSEASKPTDPRAAAPPPTPPPPPPEAGPKEKPPETEKEREKPETEKEKKAREAREKKDKDDPKAAQAGAAPRKQVPAVCRAVHYVLPEKAAAAGQHRAATISAVGKGNVCTLHVMILPGDFAKAWHPGPMAVQERVEYSEECLPGTWHWPEQV